MMKTLVSSTFGETPLTDPRSLGSSALFHGLLLFLLWLVVLNATVSPVLEPTTRPIQADLRAVDNRADRPQVKGEGGGSPGELGGVNKVPLSSPESRASLAAETGDPTADALLAEILPDTQSRGTETPQRALPGPRTCGAGIIPGTGMGGGGGSGGGTGSGTGRGIGPGTQFFGARDHAHSFAYVIDCSGSMNSHNSLTVAKRELLASLNQLPPDAEFTVIFYSLVAKMLSDTQGRRGMMSATSANKTRVQTQLSAIIPDGGTDHMAALNMAMALKPEVIFFLTDADLMTNGDVDKILTNIGSTRIQAVEFGRGPPLNEKSPLHRLSNTTGGSYFYIDVSKFPR